MTSDPNRTLDRQIEFARHNFESHQAIIRASDAKAGVLVTVMFFLAASSLPVSRDAIGKLRWSSPGVAIVSSLLVLSIIGLVLAVVWSLVAAQRVLKPRWGSRYKTPQKDRDLMWQDHVLLHATSQEYGAAVRAASDDLILQNLTDQVFELAEISKIKMDALYEARWAVYLAFCCWTGSVACSVILWRLN
jgi:hypothetical protein